MAGDITRFTFNALNFFNSETIDGFTNEEVGQYVLLMCKSILLGKECSLPDDISKLANYARTTERKLSSRVLEQYPVVLTEFGPRRRNSVLYGEWLNVSKKSQAAQLSADKRWEKNPLESTKQSSERIASVLPSQSIRNANRTEQNITEQNKTEHAGQSFVQPNGIGAELDEVSADMAGGVSAARGTGTPGFFKRGQYPGTDPKRIWQHCSAVYRRIVGESGYLRYPTKHPQAQTDKWADLCSAVSSDLIVPAFELWVAREGHHIKTQWALSEFLKGETASQYLEMISPLNEIKPKISKDQVESSAAVAKAQHETLWATEEAKSTEPGPEAF